MPVILYKNTADGEFEAKRETSGSDNPAGE
jgi:hypothetical protein